MAKTMTEAQKNEKIAALLTRREALERELKNTEQSHKRNKLISQIETTEEKIKKVRTGERFTRQEKRDMVAYSFIAPNFIGFAVFTLGPIIFAFVLAFMKWDGNSPMEFAGLKNFIQMAGNARFRSSFINTIVYCLATVPFTLACALGLAVLLNQKVKGRNFFRTVSFFPYVASLVAVAAVWNMLFSPQKSGPINMILYQLGVSAKSLPKWAADPHWVMFTIVLFSVWKNMGYYMVIYIASLQSVSEDLTEAARIDGANGWQVLTRIKLPLISPTIVTCIILCVASAMKTFELPWTMTSGGPAGASTTMVLKIYNTAFNANRTGYATAQSTILFVLIASISFVLNIIMRRREAKLQ